MGEEMSLRVTLLVAAAAQAAAFHSYGNWSQLPENPYGAHEWHTVVGSGGDLFATGGSDNSTVTFSVLQNKWTKNVAKFPGGPSIVATDADMIGSTIFLFGGKKSGTVVESDNTVYALHTHPLTADPPADVSNDWQAISILGSPSNHPAGRDGHSTTHCGGNIWVFGGWDEKKYYNDLWFLTPYPTKQSPGGSTPGAVAPRWSGVWNKVGAIHVNWPEERNSHTMTCHGGSLYMFGGFSHDTQGGTNPWTQCDKATDKCVYHNDVWKYDIALNLWEELPVVLPVPAGRARHAAAILNGGMYVFGGVEASNGAGSRTVGDLWRFDLKLHTWMKMDNVGTQFGTEARPTPRSQMQMVAMGDSMYIYGGNNGSVSAQLWKYTPWTGFCDNPQAEAAEYGALTAWLVIFLLLWLATTAYLCVVLRRNGYSAFNRGPSSGSAELGKGSYGNYQSQS